MPQLVPVGDVQWRLQCTELIQAHANNQNNKIAAADRADF